MNPKQHPNRSAICATCRRRLIPVNQYDGAGVLIEERFDHPPKVPGVDCTNLVPIITDGVSADQVSVCDFCHTPGVSWEFTAEEFTVPGDENHIMDELWLACPACASDVEAQAWDRIIERWSVVNRAVVNAKARAHFIGIFSQFSLNRRGAPKPV